MKSCLRCTCVLTALSAPLLRGQVEVWQQQLTQTAAPGAERAVFDEHHGVLLAFTGQTGETWQYDGNDWLQRHPNHSPPGRSQFFLGYDPIRQRVLLYGGLAGSRLSDTWEWDGDDWAQVGTTDDERFDGAMAFDPVRRQMLRFGGGGPGGVWGETRAWNGSQWLLLGSGGPAPRQSVAMVCDSLRRCVVLYGGYGPSAAFGNRFDDTWVWDGSVWAQRFPAFAPPRLSGHAMTFDSDKGWAFMANGSIPQSGGPTTNHDLYAFDGFDWSLRANSQSPFEGPLVYDSSRKRLVTFTSGQTWRYTAPAGVPASLQLFGSGCPGSGGVPSLATVNGELPYIGYPLHVDIANLGGSPFVLPFGVVGFSDSIWSGAPLPLDLGFLGFPGCVAYCEAFGYSVLLNQGGTAHWNLSIPFVPGFASTPMFLQGFVLDGGAPVGAAVSNAAALVIGRR